MEGFEKLTIAVVASTERSSLRETIRLLAANCDAEDIAEIFIFLISSDCPSASVAAELEKNNPYPVPIRSVVQVEPGLSPAIFEIPPQVHSSHLLIIASDLEMDPLSVPELIELSKKHPQAIVCASKFMRGSKRKGYGFVHYVGNRAANLMVERLLDIRGTELMSTFEIYPMELYRRMGFNNSKRAFYQYTIRPLSLGAEYIEIPTDYIRRSEGASNFNLKKYVDLGVTFVRTALDERKRLRSKSS